MVLFTVWFICLLVVGSYVCKFVCQFVGWGGYVWYWVCLFVGWWLCDNVISFNSRDGVSVGLFYYRFKAIPWILNQMGGLLAILGFFLSIFFLCGLLLLCVLPWVICFIFGWCECWAFFTFFLFCDKYLNCYVLGGEFEQLAAINCFWNILGGPEIQGLWGVRDPHGMAGY